MDNFMVGNSNPSYCFVSLKNANFGMFSDVRVAALETIVDYIKTDGRFEDAEFLLNILENDPVPNLKHDLCRIIIRSLSEKSVSIQAYDN